MRRLRDFGWIFGFALLVLNPVNTGLSQSTSPRPWCRNVIMPQTYRSSVAGNYRIHVSEVRADVSIVEQVATTRLDVGLKNTSSSNEMAELLIPVPAGAVIKSFTFQGEADEQKTELLTKLDAKSTFDSVVAKLKDPALLEFAGFNLIRTSVFPVPAEGDQKIRIVYEHLLSAVGDRIDYVLPRSGSVVYDTPWKINVKLKSKRSITTVYSPSHMLTTSPVNQKKVTASLAENASSAPGPFNLSFLLDRGAMTASMFTHPNADGKGGYFLLLSGMGGTQEKQNDKEEKIDREITLVIDRSGSMSGKKIEQAKEATLQVLEGLEMGESFNIVTYSDEVEVFSEESVIKSKETLAKARAFVEAIIARGGTNLHAALQRSLQNPAAEGMLPIVLFLTDGLPTVGETSEVAIREVASEQNPHDRRVFTFGVGYDVNTPLLDKVATSTRGFATFVLPTEDVETKVARVFRGLDGPTLAAPKLRMVNAKGKPSPKRIKNLLPNVIPDLYDGDQLVLLGQYQGKKPLHFEISGNHRGKPRTFTFEFDVKQSMGTNNSFVARLWASRRIAQLIDSIRDLGATEHMAAAAAQVSQLNSSVTSTLTSATPQLDSKLKELTGEIVAISKEFGILTEYTSFLAEEGIDLSDKDAINAKATENLRNRAMFCRSGIGSVNQEFNNKYQRTISCANVDNRYWTSDMKQATITNVQQCNLGAYYRRGNRWISNRLIDEEKDIKPDRTIEFGTPEFNQLVWKLVEQRRNNELALDGDILITVDDETVLIKGVTPEAEEESESEK